jgi:hypothetical protein
VFGEDVEMIPERGIEMREVDRFARDDESMKCRNENDLRVVVGVEKQIKIRDICALVVREGRRIAVIRGTRGVNWQKT